MFKLYINKLYILKLKDIIVYYTIIAMNPNTNDTLEKIFTYIYNQNSWDMGQSDSKSGLGSSNEFTIYIRKHIIDIVNKFNIKNMIDTSCGDLFWMKQILPDLPCDYTGIDIVKDIVDNNTVCYTNINSNIKIEFKHSSFLEYLKGLPNNSVDLILCRHTCEHLPTEYVINFINEAIRVSKYLLLTTHKLATENREVSLTHTPYRPVNLNLTPYAEVLDSYQIDSLYDGSNLRNIPEMYINLYKFN